MKTIKILTLIVIGIASVGWSWHSLNLNISKKDYLIQSSPTSIIVSTSDFNQELFRISPFDDYTYSNNSKIHFSNSSDNTKLKPLPVDYISQLQNLISQQKKISWMANTPRGNLTYNVEIGTDNSVVVSRDISQLPTHPDSIGLSVVICQSCFVTDQKKRIYINQSYLKEDMVSLFASEGLIPTVSSDQIIPEDVTDLVIMDNNFNRRFTIPVSKNQSAYYDQKWNLIELRSSAETINNQVIYLK